MNRYARAPNVSALLKESSYGTNLHLEETGFKEGSSAASSIILGITKILIGLTGRIHWYQAKRKEENHVCGRSFCKMRGVTVESWQTSMSAEDALGSWRARLDKELG